MSELELACHNFTVALKGKKQEEIVDLKYRDLALKGSTQTRKLKLVQNKSTRSAYER